ncbi:MAG: DUF3298 and DUF4163 domain-containing protein [Sulfurovum sp.]|nr:DUF3298 and DUF4163 domain-containing protein [Sulfurovum sp.]
MHYLFILLLLTSILSSEEMFLDKKWSSARGVYSLEESYCHPTKKQTLFCQKDSLSYPLFTESPNKNIQDYIEKIVNSSIQTYKNNNLKKEVLENLSDASYQPSVEWETSNSIDLFTVTKKTFTMVNSASGYLGGAHGYYRENYDNYTHEGKHLLLKDILKKDSNSSLHKIAQRVYKNSVGLAVNESLTKDGWFDNKFVLTSNFAITTRGLRFHYNSYEIKPYSSGHTDFMLPYSAIRLLIDPDGSLSPYLKPITQIETAFHEPEIATLKLNIERISKTELRIVLDENTETYAARGWLSLSFSQLTKKSEVKIISSKGFKSTKVYPKGSKIYHILKKKAIKSKYLLVEGETDNKHRDETKQMTLLVTLPSGLQEFKLLIRASFKNDKVVENIPSDYGAFKGQQGFNNYKIIFPLQ